MSAHGTPENPSNVVELPRTWLASLFQHVASGPGGLASAAALSQTCKSLHDLSESSAVTYRRLCATQSISSAEYPLWQWLAKRKGRIAGVQVKVELDASLSQEAVQAEQPAWERVLQTLSSIADLHLTVSWEGLGQVSTREHPYISQWLEQYGHHINLLDACVGINADSLAPEAFSVAAALCKSLRLKAVLSSGSLDCSSLAPISSSLISLDMGGVRRPTEEEIGLRNMATLTCFTQLTALSFGYLYLTDEDPWTPLAVLTGLSRLSLDVAASGDPSPLSALTGLRSLRVKRCFFLEQGPAPFSFSSLQPLSTLQQLEVLELRSCCQGTSLQGLAELSRLTELHISNTRSLKSLEGASTAILSLNLDYVLNLASLHGIEGLVALDKLSMTLCGVTSLEPLAGVGSLRHLTVIHCPITGLEGLGASLGTCLQELLLSSCEHLSDLSGVEKLSALQQLTVLSCGVTSLQPVAELDSGLKTLKVLSCGGVQEGVLKLPYVLPTADVDIMDSNVQEVVLAGGVRREVSHSDYPL